MVIENSRLPLMFARVLLNVTACTAAIISEVEIAVENASVSLALSESKD